MDIFDKARKALSNNGWVRHDFLVQDIVTDDVGMCLAGAMGMAYQNATSDLRDTDNETLESYEDGVISSMAEILPQLDAICEVICKRLEGSSSLSRDMQEAMDQWKMHKECDHFEGTCLRRNGSELTDPLALEDDGFRTQLIARWNDSIAKDMNEVADVLTEAQLLMNSRKTTDVHETVPLSSGS